MALSPNYAWAEPDNSSLVKNGAQDIRALGDAIDTSVWNVGYGQAGKNKIINGDFSINQRSFTSGTATGVFAFDRFAQNNVDGTCTASAQTFTPGAAPVAGYEAANYFRFVTTGQTATSALAILTQRIEDVRTLAGQPVTVSFWAQSGSGTPSIAIELDQQFGSGGSTRVTNFVGKTAISTSWTRYSATITLPSMSGKTIGTGSYLGLGLWVSAGSDFNSRTGSLGIQTNTFNIWGVQVEYGSKATPFQTASGGSPQAELAMCQRYYFRASFTSTGRFGVGFANSVTEAFVTNQFPVEMRIPPTALEQSGVAANYTVAIAGAALTSSAVPTFGVVNTLFAVTVFNFTAGLTPGAGCIGRPLSGAYLGWSAEL
jgi:hypothetical protein